MNGCTDFLTIGEWRISQEARGGRKPCKRRWTFVEGCEVHRNVKIGDVVESPDPPFTSAIRALDEGGLDVDLGHLRRIVACLNFCRQFGTEFLEQRQLVHAESDNVRFASDIRGFDGFVPCVLIPVAVAEKALEQLGKSLKDAEWAE